MKFYCNACKKFLDRSDAVKRKLVDKTGSKYYCPNCNSLLIFVCETCQKGLMLKAKNPIPTGDWDESGTLQKFCSICGYGFLQYTPFSRRKIKKTVDIIFTNNGLPYHKKKELLQEMFTKCKSEQTAMEFLQNRFPIKNDTISSVCTIGNKPSEYH